MSNPSSRFNPGQTERWASFRRNPDPAVTESNWELSREEVLWDHVAINDLLKRAFPSTYSYYYVNPGDLNVALALGPNKYGTHEIVIHNSRQTTKSYLWAIISERGYKQPSGKVTNANNPAYADRVTAGLMRDALKTHGLGRCPKCKSEELKQIRTALVCMRCNTMVGGF